MAPPPPPAYDWLVHAIQTLLDRLGISNAGTHQFHPQLQLLKNGGEAGSDFGLAGTLALVGSAAALCSCRWRSLPFRLAAAGALSLAIVSYTTAWMPWNARFLLIPFALGACNLGVIVGHERLRYMRWPTLLILAASGLAAIFQSSHRNPSMFAVALQDRDRAMTSERPAMLEIVRDLKDRAGDLQHGIYLYSGSDSWVFAVMHRMPFRVTPAPQLEGLESRPAAAGTHILILDKELPALDPRRFAIVRRYEHSQSFLVQILPTTGQ